ncbi:hypothetical protein [Actinomadura kijaniata]|uniref:hypothetical protein n=1 Tax=Actinomadura kijaniata TaxID=46161 RepID=UPI00082C4B78|nr:hypothetical protein [Actinomadura kijaniata]
MNGAAGGGAQGPPGGCWSRSVWRRWRGRSPEPPARTGRLSGWWDGFFLLAFRTFCWMFMSFVPVGLVEDVVAFGLEVDVGLAVYAGVAVLFTAVPLWMLWITLDRW